MSDSQSGSNSGSDADNDSGSSSDVVMHDAAAVAGVKAEATVQATKPATSAPKKKKTAYEENGEVKMLFTASALKPAVHEQGCNISGTVPALVNTFLVQTLKYYCTRPNAAFSMAPTSSLTIELKPTLVDAFVADYKLTSQRRTVVKTFAKNACAFMLESAMAICKSQDRKTISDTDVVTAAQITKKVISGAAPIVVAPPASPKKPKASKKAAPAAGGAKKPKAKKGAVVSHAVVSAADGDDAAVSTSGPNVPPPKKKKRPHAELTASIEE